MKSQVIGFEAHTSGSQGLCGGLQRLAAVRGTFNWYAVYGKERLDRFSLSCATQTLALHRKKHDQLKDLAPRTPKAVQRASPIA